MSQLLATEKFTRFTLCLYSFLTYKFTDLLTRKKMSQLLAALQDNPYFGAGFGLMGLGLGASVARKGAQVGLILFRRHYMTTVEITCKDKV